MPTNKKDASTIPPAVAKQAAAAAKLQKELSGGTEPAADPTAVVQRPLQPTHPTPADPEPDAPAAPAEPVVSFVPPAIADPSAQDDATYKNKYEILQGKYDAEVPALQGQIKSLELVMANMQQAFDNQVASAPEAPTGVENNIKALNTDDFTEYGSEIVTLAEGFNAILAQNEQLIAQVRQGTAKPDGELVQRTERLEATIQKTTEDRYYEDLARAIPDWKSINRSGAFNQWLAQIDPISMAARMDILQFAANNLNAAQVVNIFNQFKADSGMVPADNPAPAPAPTVENAHLGGQIMPDTNLSNPNEMQPSGVKVVYPTTSEFKQASSDLIQKRITEPQYNDIANRYQMAIKAGKVMP